MKKSTILIAHNFSEKSFSVMSYDLSFYLAKKGHRIIFISHEPYFKEVKNIEVGKGEIVLMSWKTKKRPTTFQDFIYFYKIYKTYKPTIILAHFSASNICGIVSKIASFGKVKTIIYYHTLSSQNKLDNRHKKWKQELLFKRKKYFYNLFCDYIVCPSQLAKDDLKSVFKYDKGIVVLNPMRDRFKGKSFKMSTGEIIISYLGRLNPSKGVFTLIDAFSNYKIKFPDSKIILNLAGSGHEASSLMEKVRNNKAIFFKGILPYEKIDNYLAMSNFLIIPSKFDNLPTVGLEALMNGTPLLISDRTGLTKYLNNSVDCFIFSPEITDIELLFNKVESKLSNYYEMREEARNTYMRHFSMTEYCNKMEGIIL